MTESEAAVDEAYEYFAPTYFDFRKVETEEEIRKAERWFRNGFSYAPSPFMHKIRAGRATRAEVLCDFGEDEIVKEFNSKKVNTSKKVEWKTLSSEKKREVWNEMEKENFQKGKNLFHPEHKGNTNDKFKGSRTFHSNGSSADVSTVKKESTNFSFPVLSNGSTSAAFMDCSTPRVDKIPSKGEGTQISSKKQSAITTSNHSKKPCPKPSKSVPSMQSMRCLRPKNPTSMENNKTNMSKKNNVNDFAQENQAIKKQKLDYGRSRQIINVKNRALPHKSKPDLAADSMDLLKSCHTSILAKEPSPFISTAELVNKFQSSTRDMGFSQVDPISTIQRRTKLTLTRPKEPELGTAHRVRAVRVKSTTELEEEMLAKMPKFKALPLNKKILEEPSLPLHLRSIPKPPNHQEFNLKTMERARGNAETSSSAPASSLQNNDGKPLKLTHPNSPLLETSLRARTTTKAKTSEELEQVELEKIPKFKARPLNKKIFESSGHLGLFRNQKRQVTVPQEFHFATNDRIGLPSTVVEMFDKLSLYSDSSHRDQENSKITVPNPFRLQTEERGAEKERLLLEQKLQKELVDGKARIPKANPYPYTTDYPVIPPKPTPKPSTKPEAFQLESLIRHEEVHRKMEERERMEKEEARKRTFKAQPVMKADPLPLPEKGRKPLTEVQEFVLHVNDRAIHRLEFDKNVKEKEFMYKRMREENETSKRIEEQKAVKQMRRTMIHQARPVPSFANPFLPQKSEREPTKARSPDSNVIKRAQLRRSARLR